MKEYIHELSEGLAEELKKRFGTVIATEVMEAFRLNLKKRMEENEG